MKIFIGLGDKSSGFDFYCTEMGDFGKVGFDGLESGEEVVVGNNVFKINKV